MEALLEIQNLSVSFTQYEKGLRRRTVWGIRDLSLTIRPGEIVAAVGASGSGKSLLAHGILGLLPYNSHMAGEIRWRGEPLTPRRLKTLRGREIALVPQGVTYLDPLMKVGPQIRHGRRDAAARVRSRDALGRYGLGPETEGRYPFELSGGMARRVLLAAAVFSPPKLVIADEPTPGLDAAAAARMMGHFRELAQGGAGVLFITHDLELALTVADRVAVLYGGETVEEAQAEDFAAERLRHPYTKALWRALPENGFLPLDGAQPPPAGGWTGCRFAPRCPHCRPECKKEEVIPYRPWAGGRVRCLNPERGEEP